MKPQLDDPYDELKELKDNMVNEFHYFMDGARGIVKYVTSINFGIPYVISAFGNVWNEMKTLVTLSDNVILLSVICFFLLVTWGMISRLQIILKARNSSVLFNWNGAKAPHVGEVGILKLSFQSPDPASINKLLRLVVVKVTLGHEEIVVEKEASEAQQCIFLKFQIQRSGKYEIDISYEGYPVLGSPFTAIVDPDEMDLSKTTIDWSSPIILIQGEVTTLEILPKDQYGNRCTLRSDNLSRFQFRSTMVLEYENGPKDFALKSSFSIRRDMSIPERLLDILCLHLKTDCSGVFYGQVLYNGLPFHDQDLLEFVSISKEEELFIIEREYQENNCIDFKATMDTGKQIVLELSPRFFYLKETIFDGMLHTRLATFRVCKQTVVKIQYAFQKAEEEMYRIKIIDDNQNQSQLLEMTARDFRIFMVLIAKFSASGINDFLTLETKRMQFYNELRNLNPERPRSSYKILKIRRENLIESTLKETQHFTRVDWGKPFVVSFYGEDVRTDGCAWLDWSESLMEIFFENNSHGMFCSFGSSGLLHPNPNRSSRWTPLHYELAGKVVGKYFIETALDKDGTRQYHINARFTRSFLAQILSLKPTYTHMELDDPEVYASTIQPILLHGNLSSMNLKFTETIYDDRGRTLTRELIPNGSTTQVTNQNKDTYANALASHRLETNVKKEVEAFVSGLTIIIPNDLLMTFNENELELVMCGSSEFTLRDLQCYHVSSGIQWNPHLTRIKEWLWTCLAKMSTLDIGRFLQFITGSSRLPPGGFVELKPRLKISISCLYGQLPHSNKLLHELCLTDHPTIEDFNRALIKAIRGEDLNSNHISTS